jgi:hypothetical protein
MSARAAGLSYEQLCLYLLSTATLDSGAVRQVSTLDSGAVPAGPKA